MQAIDNALPVCPLLSLAGILGERRFGVTLDDMDAGIAEQVGREFEESTR